MNSYPPLSTMLPIDPTAARRDAILKLLQQPPMPTESPLGANAATGAPQPPGLAPKPFATPTAMTKKGKM